MKSESYRTLDLKSNNPNNKFIHFKLDKITTLIKYLREQSKVMKKYEKPYRYWNEILNYVCVLMEFFC